MWAIYSEKKTEYGNTNLYTPWNFNGLLFNTNSKINDIFEIS